MASRVWGGLAASVAAVLVVLLGTAIAAPNEPGNARCNVNMNADGSDPSRYFGKWDGHKYFPSSPDWRAETIYQFVTDRYADGDPRNNEGRYGGYDPTDVGKRHGGDFKGITAKLDYIKSLGFTAIWVSPVFQNRYNSYHGYAQIDFTVLDDRFGTLDDFREMVDEAHKRGIYVIVDIVVNHMDNLLYFEGHRDSGAPFRMHSGEYRLFYRNESETYRDFPIDNTFYGNGGYGTVYGYDGYPKVDTDGGSFWFSDFHHNGDLQDYGDPFQNHLGKIYGIMDDLRTEHPRVQAKIIAMTKALISSVDIDGIRMDTPMQVPLSFFQAWAPAVRDHAKSLGKDDFLIYGEFFCSRERAATMTGRGKTPDMWGKDSQFIGGDNQRTLHGGIAYTTYNWYTTSVQQQQNNPRGLVDTLKADLSAYDFYDPARGERRYTQFSFYNNHDQWRMSAAADGFNKTDLASAILLLFPGVPLFYYGDEQGFLTKGTALDGWSREDFFTSIAWKDLKTVDGHNPCEGDNFDMANPHFLHVQRLNALRRAYVNLHSCDDVYERWTQSGNTNGVFAFSRTCRGQDDWVLVAFNTWSTALDMGGNLGALYTGWNAGDVIVNALNPSEAYTLGANGVLPSAVSIPPYGYKVFVRQGSYRALEPVVVRTEPAHDAAIVTDNPVAGVNIKVRFSEPMDKASVVGAFSVAGHTVNTNMVQYDASTNELSYLAMFSPGIVSFSVAEGARTADGKRSLRGRFSARFRIGSGRRNVIINNKLGTDDALVVRGDGAKGEFVVDHASPGAELSRVHDEFGAVSEWEAFRLGQQTVRLSVGYGKRTITAQYYADNSAVYFVSGTVNIQYPFAHSLDRLFARGTFNAWTSSNGMSLVGDNVWRTVVTVGAKGAAEFKFDVGMDWTNSFGDNNGDGVADANGASIRIAHGDSDAQYEITFNDVTLAYTVKPFSASLAESEPEVAPTADSAASLGNSNGNVGASSTSLPLYVTFVFSGKPAGAKGQDLLTYFQSALPVDFSNAIDMTNSTVSRFAVLSILDVKHVHGSYYVNVAISETSQASVEPTASTLYSRLFAMYADPGSALWTLPTTSMLSKVFSPFPTGRGDCQGDCGDVSSSTKRDWILGGVFGFVGAVLIAIGVFWISKGREKRTRHELTRPLMHA